ncbi:MAG: hypothetical protein R2758_14075 [Bacteroidales bacterium]
MHTAEHVLNSVMDKMYHCGRSFNSHIETKRANVIIASVKDCQTRRYAL